MAGGVCLLNVVVAVLLDEFISTVVREKETCALATYSITRETKRHISNTLATH